ncbi:MAG: right-handed parallel beta-helix repeat-containing protein [Deltaproteobacteria bacterium]|nr:right-handed parallel beta-helix repeat-containing protein [Deltaproteobacteria bacterium]
MRGTKEQLPRSFVRATRARRGFALVGTIAAAGAWSMPAAASDGVLEINQTCATQTGCFAGDTAGLPVTINGSAGRSYRLTSDLVVPTENTDGIQISTDTIRIDLAGFEIRGPVVCSGTPLTCVPSTGTGSGVEANVATLSGISVRNGSIRGMGSFGVFLGIQAEVTELRVSSNRQYGIYASVGSTVSGSKANLNGTVGIYAEFGSVVSGNTAHHNGVSGIFVSSGSTVSGNTSYQNGDDGIVTGSGSTVSGNASTLNGGDGISANAGSIVSGNTVRSNNFFGLFLGTQAGYRENVVTNNTGGTVSGASAVNLGNNACNGSTVCP